MTTRNEDHCPRCGKDMKDASLSSLSEPEVWAKYIQTGLCPECQEAREEEKPWQSEP